MRKIACFWPNRAKHSKFTLGYSTGHPTKESPGEVEGEVGRGHGVVGHDTLGSLSNNDGDGYGNVT